MRGPVNAIACLGAALLLVPGLDARADASPQSPAGESQQGAATASGAPAAQGTGAQGTGAQGEGAQAPNRRESRRTKRTTRASSRQRPSPPGAEQDEKRLSRVPGPTLQHLTLTANAVGGYDDNLTAGLETSGGFAPTAQGTTGYLAANLDYSLGNSLRAIHASSTADLRAYPGYMDHPPAGTVTNIDGRTELGRRVTIRGAGRVSYEPFFSVLSPEGSSVALPAGSAGSFSAAGLFKRRSLNSNGSGSLEQRWTPRQSSWISYAYNTQRFTEGEDGSNTSHQVTATHRAKLAVGVRLRTEYRYLRRQSTAGADELQTREHRIEGGPEIDRTLSRRHRLSLWVTAGANRLASVRFLAPEPYRAWVPVGSARAALTLSPTWSVESGYRRDFSLLQGVTQKVYKTDTAFANASGLLVTRLGLSLGATYSFWKTPLAFGLDDRLRVYGASLQVHVSLATSLSASAAYYYYYHRYSNPAALPAGFPGQYDRHAVRVGLTFWVPLAGKSSPPPLLPDK